MVRPKRRQIPTGQNLQEVRRKFLTAPPQSVNKGHGYIRLAKRALAQAMQQSTAKQPAQNGKPKCSARCKVRQARLSALIRIGVRVAVVAALGSCWAWAVGAATISPINAWRNTPITLVTGHQNESKIKTFTGVIAKKDDHFILMGESRLSYHLDDQKAAEQFAGKKVKVKGILDSVSNTIRIQTIEVAAA